MSREVYELRREGVTVCTSSMPLLGYSPGQIKQMEKDGLRLYRNGKREKAACGMAVPKAAKE